MQRRKGDAVQFFQAILAVAGMAAASVQSQSSGWELRPAADGHGAVLSVDADDSVTYRFECASDAVIVTQTGVTKLIDLKTGNHIGDDAAAVMPPGAAMMALFGGKGDPKFVPAEAVKNPAGGWDLTIRLPKGDKQLKALGKSEMMSLFTTGYTIAVVMDAESRGKWSAFVQACPAAG
jgi:hypothetical protein